MYRISSVLTVSLLIIFKISGTHAWLWPLQFADSVDSNLEDVDATISTDNSEMEANLEDEDIENEENLKCAQHFNRNLYKVLKSMIPRNATERKGRQDDTNTSPDELVESMLNLEISQIIGPVLKLVGSAAAANATAIDENYNSLPLAVRYQVNDFIKFAVDLLTTT